MPLPKIPLGKTDYNVKGVQITLFYQCNLSCPFCFQRLPGEHPITPAVKELVANNIKKIASAVPTFKEPCIEFKLLGGEIFMASTDWNWLTSVVESLINIAKDNKKTARIVFMTNLVHGADVVERVLTIQRFAISAGAESAVIAPSFDFSGRFMNRAILSRFAENCRVYDSHKVLSQCNIVLTATACRLLTGKQEPTEIERSCLDVFNELYDSGIAFDVDYYAARPGEDPLLPTDNELLDAMLYLCKHYPKMRLMRTFLNYDGRIKPLECQSELQVENNVCTDDCVAFFGQQDNPDLCTASGTNYKERVVKSFMDRKGCLLCPYYCRCPMGCFFFWDNKAKKMHEDSWCLYRELFNQIV